MQMRRLKLWSRLRDVPVYADIMIVTFDFPSFEMFSNAHPEDQQCAPDRTMNTALPGSDLRTVHVDSYRPGEHTILFT